ncbi:MAG: hypothetical protein RLY86_3876, partial [Pseudomonadota bacterium]
MPRRSKNAVVAALETSIENHVAGRIRLRRGLLGMSQSDLARTLGITFQQVQKYERGSNRVSVGKLYRLAEILDVPLTFFFDGLDGASATRSDGAEASPGDDKSPLLSRRELDLLRTWRMAPTEISDAVGALLRSLAAEGDPLPEGEQPTFSAPAGTPSAPRVESAPASEPKRRGRPP